VSLTTSLQGFTNMMHKATFAQMAESGSVLFNFERRGEIALEGVDEERAFEAAMDAAAEDVEPISDDSGELAGYKVVCTADNFGRARDALHEMGIPVKVRLQG
jgi:transcriptional/translational regulatory protein YebC/TACO1